MVEQIGNVFLVDSLSFDLLVAHDGISQPSFAQMHAQQLELDRILHRQTVHLNLLRLAYPVDAVDSLVLYRGIPPEVC